MASRWLGTAIWVNWVRCWESWDTASSVLCRLNEKIPYCETGVRCFKLEIGVPSSKARNDSDGKGMKSRVMECGMGDSYGGRC